jgi:hypothetical protein
MQTFEQRLRYRGWHSAIVLCWLMVLPVVGQATSWRQVSSQHFQVFYRDHAAFASAVLTSAEQYYDQIRLDFGLHHVVQRDHVPWLWDDRCRIYLYADQQTYLEETGAPAWSGGFVQYRHRVIYSYSHTATFLSRTLPHEIAHILFREFVGFDNPQVPPWLDEGVAQYAESDKRAGELVRMHQWVSRGLYIPFEQFSQLPGHNASAVQVFYTQASTLVHFFIEIYGRHRFIEWCSHLRDGRSLERALSFATDGRISDLTALEEDWLTFLFSLPSP